VVGGVVIGLAATGAAVWTVFRGTGTTLSNRGDAPTAPQDLDSIRSAAEAATAAPGASAARPAVPAKVPQWIWSQAGGDSVVLRKTIEVPERLRATARFAIDNAGELSVNGQVVGENRDWSWANEVDLTPHLTVG
jgi:hypothetical protein